jgi:hypothetical protein
MYGIIYEYVDQLTGRSAYVGKAVAPFSVEQAVRNTQKRHMSVRLGVPFDCKLRVNPGQFVFRVLSEVVAPTGAAVTDVLDVMERAAVRILRPSENVVRFVRNPRLGY